MSSLELKVGEWVEVRPKEEILATLDANGRLEELPFMPPMFQYCGKRFRVYKRAHKTCDTVNRPAGRKMHATVHLEGLRCDGQAHGGCQALCLLFWKEAWLKRVQAPHTQPAAAGQPQRSTCTEEQVWGGTVATGYRPGDPDPTYVCQATQLPAATAPLSPWNIRQYIEDYTSGNTGLWEMFRGFVYATYNNTINLGIGVGAILRWFYDLFQTLTGGIRYPRHYGTIPRGTKTPHETLNLQEGELVRIKPYAEILKTVDEGNRNRGLLFDAEMVPFCGGTYRVAKRVSRIINEKTGKMMTFKNDCIILDSVFCQARYSEERHFCPRAIYSFWREVWLERVPTAEREKALSAAAAPACAGQPSCPSNKVQA